MTPVGQLGEAGLSIPALNAGDEPRQARLAPGVQGCRGELRVRVTEAKEELDRRVRQQRGPQLFGDLGEVLTGDEKTEALAAGDGHDFGERSPNEPLQDRQLIDREEDGHAPGRAQGGPKEGVGEQPRQQPRSLISQTVRSRPSRAAAGT